MGSQSADLEGLEGIKLPPGEPVPYKILAFEGEVVYLPPTLNSTRFLVTDPESKHAFGLIVYTGTHCDPILWHLHETKHDTFLCTKGELIVWADDVGRLLRPGDYAYVPPNTPHRFQIVSDHCEYIGFMVPGGYEEFFRYIGEANDSPMGFPAFDNRDAMTVMAPKILADRNEYDCVPLYDRPDIQATPWTGKERLPGNLTPYYLRNDQGRRLVVGGGLLWKPICTLAETDSKFGIASLEGSYNLSNELFSSRIIGFRDVHHAIQVVDGTLEFKVDLGDGKPARRSTLTAAETLYLPAGTRFSIHIASRYAKAYVFCDKGGLVELVNRIGEEYNWMFVPENDQQWNEQKLEDTSLQQELGYTLY